MYIFAVQTHFLRYRKYLLVVLHLHNIERMHAQKNTRVSWSLSFDPSFSSLQYLVDGSNSNRATAEKERKRIITHTEKKQQNHSNLLFCSIQTIELSSKTCSWWWFPPFFNHYYYSPLFSTSTGEHPILSIRFYIFSISNEDWILLINKKIEGIEMRWVPRTLDVPCVVQYGCRN